MLICFIGLCLYLHGTALVKTLAFPIAYLAFAIPIPGGVLDVVGFPMQLWASGSTAHLLRLMQIDVTRTGVDLTVLCSDFAIYRFQVVQACSGMSSLVALVGVTAVFAYITNLPVRFKWLLFCLSLPIALAANVLRITSIGLVGWQWGPDVAQHVFHDWSSPILFHGRYRPYVPAKLGA